jgi:hypothetical protein
MELPVRHTVGSDMVTFDVEDGGKANGKALGGNEAPQMTAQQHYDIMMKSGFQDEEEDDNKGDEISPEQEDFEALMKMVSANARTARAARESAELELAKRAEEALKKKPKSKLLQQFEEMEEPVGENVVAGKALFCLSENVVLRHTLNRWVTHPLTENFLLFCILVNTVILAVQTPTNTLDDDTNANFELADAILSVIFSGA